MEQVLLFLGPALADDGRSRAQVTLQLLRRSSEPGLGCHVPLVHHLQLILAEPKEIMISPFRVRSATSELQVVEIAQQTASFVKLEHSSDGLSITKSRTSIKKPNGEQK